jgi:hypothetical protein
VSNYIGLRNRFGILGEAYAYATFEERIGISYWFTREIVEFAHGNAAEIQERAATADARNLIDEMLGVRAEVVVAPEPVDILMGETVEETNPFTGATILRRTETQVPTPMHDMGSFRFVEPTRVPAAYYISPGSTQGAGRPGMPGGGRPMAQGMRAGGSRELREILVRLEAHGLEMATLEAPETVELEIFAIDSVTTSEREYEGHQAQEVWGRYRTEARTLQPGTVRIPMGQPLARVAFALLEPRSDDGFVAWGFLMSTLQEGMDYPVTRAAPGGEPAPSG